jgi:homoserine dehydrogenase
MRIVLIGFGTVGQSFVKLIDEGEDYLRNRYGLEFELVAVSDIIKGSVMDPEGLDKAELLKLVTKTGSIKSYSQNDSGFDSVESIRKSDADVVVEVSWTNLETGEPGITHIREALSLGKHVVTSNKGPIALAYHELNSLAKEKGVQLRYECTVMSGTPAIILGSEGLAGNKVMGFRGVLNGTTNFILSRMEQGATYESALKEAQGFGYAEVDPSADVEGWDAVGKTVILANTLMGARLKPLDVKRQGITGITVRDIEESKKRGGALRLVAEAWTEGSKVEAKVSPKTVDSRDPLARLSGALNALTITTEGLGDVTIIGKGAGGVETGHGIISDLIAIKRLSGH